MPGGAFVQVARGIYNGVMTFVEKGKQIAQVGAALLDSATAIAAGQLAPAALAVENTLVNILPVALNFLAQWLGLGGIGQAIRDGLKKVQAPVERAVNRVLDVVVDKAKAVWGAAKAGAGKVVDKGRQVATAVGNKAAGWLGLQKKFTVGSETHTLFFDPREPGQLMIASVVTAYDVFLARVGEIMSMLTPQQQKAYKQATLLATKIGRKVADGLRREVDVTATVTPWVEQLADYTVTLMPAVDAVGVATATGHTPSKSFHHIEYGGLTDTGGFGTSAILTFAGTAISSAGGTEAYRPLRKKGLFQPLDARRYGGEVYYILGHLINHRLGGTGKDMKNLTPLFNLDNGNHYRGIEKLGLDEEKNAALDPDLVVSYSVFVTYGRTVNESIITEAKTTGHPQAAFIEQIVRAERHVPLTLVTRLRTWNVNNPAKFLTEKEKTINNNIGQNLNDYQVDRFRVGNSGILLYLEQPLHNTPAGVLVRAGLRPNEAVAIATAATSGIAFTSISDAVTRAQRIDPTLDNATLTVRLSDLVNNRRVNL